MLFNSKKRLVITALIAVVTGMSLNAVARPNIQANTKRATYDKGKFRTTAGCRPAVASIDLDINNVRARLMTGGDMWWNIGISEAGYEVPKGSRKHSLFAGSIWVGGYDPQGQLKVAAQTYRQDGNDYWPGPLEDNDDVSATTCAEWDRFWKVNKSDIIAFRDLMSRNDQASVENDTRFDAIREWPATNNPDAKGISGTPLQQLQTSTRSYAPFIDVDNDGKYNWREGDYPGVPTGNEPDLPGDQYIWWVFNDRGNVKQQTQTEAIGLEVQASAFAFSTKDVLNDATFYRYRMINRSNLSLDSAYVATWTDADLGYPFDDYIGCDTARELGILYNGTSVDGSGQINSYGNQVPMVGVDFFEGPRRKIMAADGVTDSFEVLGMSGFYYYNNDFSPIGNPSNGQHIYGYMTGSTRGGLRFTFDWDGVPGSRSTATTAGRPLTQFVYPGDPGNNTQWSECACNNLVGDRRFVHSSGPFQLEAGAENTITIAAIWVADAGGCPNTSFSKIRAASDLAQELYESNFQVIRGPDAPRLVVREMDRKLIFYMLNDDSRSNNFQEKFGYDTAGRYQVSSAKSKDFPDSLYKFEGYRVFQLKHAQVQPADIFDENGAINTDLAIEVFQTDIRNGVGAIRNWNREDFGNGNDSTWTSVMKVEGRDSGLVHSFSLQFDAFATGADKRFVNYRNYYFVAIAYAYNDFAAIRDTATGLIVPSFSGSTRASAANTQDMPYLEGDKAPGGENLVVVAAMPNPANGEMGTVLNSDYGTGVIIKRIEGTGNGGLALQMSQASEDEALAGPDYHATQPLYEPGQGPVDIKVIDPLKVKPGKWELYIKGTVANDERGVVDSLASWELVYNDGADVIYSERNLKVVNDQLLEKYGLSVTVKQVVRPGEDQVDRNGYITSSVVFSDPGKTWLAGVSDGEGRVYTNWIRSGKNLESNDEDGNPPPCNWNDTRVPGGSGTIYMDSVGQFYENMFSSNGLVKGTWAPYALASDETRAACGFGVIYTGSATLAGLNNVRSVDIVMTPDKSKWTECVVIEMQDDATLAEGNAGKFRPRNHASWTGEVDAAGNPVYDNTSRGKSWFPGYAIDQETGMRLNIAFAEDSWLKGYNGNDMIWNPTSELLNEMGGPIFGGKHYIYILNTKYDRGAELHEVLSSTNPFVPARRIPAMMMWVGLPMVNSNFELNSLKDGIIPTETRLRIRVDRPYAAYTPDPSIPARNNRLPLYSFSTDDLAPSTLEDADNPYASDKQKLLDKIKAVPNPYYAYAGYEINRLDTRVRITNLPRRATVNVYSLDGSLVRRLEKDNPNVSYIDWDIRNAKGLPIASGMYLIHVNAGGIGETVLRWFGAMRPIDVTNY